MSIFKVKFQPDGIKVEVRAGATIMQAAQQAGIVLNSVCGGAGTCNKCLVNLDGSGDPVQACRCPVDRDMTVTIPESSRFFGQKILQEGISLTSGINPVVCKHYLQLSQASLEDLRSDATRLIDAVDCGLGEKCHTCHNHTGTASETTSVQWDLLRQLPTLLRQNNYNVTAICHVGRIFALEPGDTTKSLFGVAVDVGTTTVVADLVDLHNGHTLAVASATNPQVSFGDDVISRIQHCGSNPDGLEQLHNLIVGCINQLIENLCRQSSVAPGQIYELTAAGNTTMQHILLSIPVGQIAQAPYVAAVAEPVNVPAQQLGINIHPQGNVYVLPGVAGHVGGDTVAVALATALDSSEKINLAIDIGTNGEMVLGNKDKLLTCSTAAGPAFEGGRISCGMRGAASAIERVYIDPDSGQVELAVIDNGKPAGLCGSGLIDAVAELLAAGLIDQTGRLLSGKKLPDNISPALRDRIVQIDNSPAFVLATAQQSKQGHDITLTQRDIRELQLGSAAIRAGITTLINELNITDDQIDCLFLAGAFGNYIRPESAIRIGLIPPLDMHKILPVGNAARAGARHMLLSRTARNCGQILAKEIKYVELAGRTDFQNTYSQHITFPDP
jgi:uncharacterized 2Fe-2S/4Fe-4S cluster protein (DUF4445 family)